MISPFPLKSPKKIMIVKNYVCAKSEHVFLFAKHVGQEQFSFDILFAERLSCCQRILPHLVSFHRPPKYFKLYITTGQLAPHKYFKLYIALHCSQKILPHSVSFHPNTFNFILQLDNGATQILFTLHCFTLLPENTSPLGFLSPAHPNTAPPTQIHFTLQLDNGRHQVDTPPTKNSHKLSMYFQLNLLTHRSQILTKLNTVKPSSIVART